MDRLLSFAPKGLRARMAHSVETQTLRGLLRFYKIGPLHARSESDNGESPATETRLAPRSSCGMASILPNTLRGRYRTTPASHFASAM